MSVTIDVEVPDPLPACPKCRHTFDNRLSYAMHFIDEHRSDGVTWSDPVRRWELEHGRSMASSLQPMVDPYKPPAREEAPTP